MTTRHGIGDTPSIERDENGEMRCTDCDTLLTVVSCDQGCPGIACAGCPSGCPYALSTSQLDRDVEAEHVATITLHRAWNEYRADCSCGRIGSYVGSRAAAEYDHAAHVEDAVRQDREGTP